MRFNFNGYTLLVIIALYCPTIFAERYESMDHLREVTKNFLTQNAQVADDETIEIKVNEANTPIHVRACSKDISAEYPADANREQMTAVALSCNDYQPWHVLLPVDVQIFTKVLAVKRTIAAHETLADEDLDYITYNKNRLYNGFFTKKEEVIGNESAHIITAGSILTKRNVQLPFLVMRNQTVTIIAKSNMVMVTVQGIAKSDGALNAMVKVYNPSSKRTLDAMVVGPNKTQVVS